jgi:hypothetical protein
MPECAEWRCEACGPVVLDSVIGSLHLIECEEPEDYRDVTCGPVYRAIAHQPACSSGERPCTSAVLEGGRGWEADVKKQAATLMMDGWRRAWTDACMEGCFGYGTFHLTEWITERGRLRAVRR